MASFEELSASITEQLRSFDNHNTELRRALEQENKALRARLSRERTSDLNLTPRFGPEKSASQILTREESEREFPSAMLSMNGARKSPSQLSGDFSFSAIRSTFTESDKVSIFSLPEQKAVSLPGVWERWRKLLAAIINMSLLGVDRNKFEGALLLRPAWEALGSDNTVKKRVTQSAWLAQASINPFAQVQSETGGPIRHSALSKFILHPDSIILHVWSLLGALMILYDVLSFPLAGFDLDESQFTLSLMCLTTAFWSSDILLSFFRGVHHGGIIELRPSRICWYYAKSWLSVDLMMVTADWFVLFMTFDGSESGNASKASKVFRVARILRAIRLIRAIKFLHYLRDAFESIKSDSVQLIIKLCMSVVAILILSHYVTCAWFAQAHFNGAAAKTWITVYLSRLPRPSFAEEYFTSMHFSLTQLSGSQNIVPQNSQERLVACIIIVFDIVIFSALVGIITDIMAQFRSLTIERSREVLLIKKFFSRCDIPPPLETRIWHFFRRHYRSKNLCVHENDIQFFTYLPSSLKMDLHQHLYIPTLSAHPLFRKIQKCDTYSLLAVCATALTTTTWVPESEMFAEGDIAKYMFFITAGVMNYRARQFDLELKVHSGKWISEAVLWTKWMHCGRMLANTSCEVITLSADLFEKTIFERSETSDWFRGLRKYAALFAQRVSDSLDTANPIADVDYNQGNELDDIVSKSFVYLGDSVSDESIEDKATGQVSSDESFHRSLFHSVTFVFKRAMSALSDKRLTLQRAMSTASEEDRPEERRMSTASEEGVSVQYVASQQIQEPAKAKVLLFL